MEQVVDGVDDPITKGLSDYVVTDELYHPHVPPPVKIDDIDMPCPSI